MSSAASASATPEFKEKLGQALDLKNQERYAEAAQILEQLREKYPQSASVHAILGEVLWQQHGAAQAIPAFQRTVELAPTSELASLGLFHTLLEIGDKQRALQEMNRFLSLSDSEEYEALAEKLKEV
jgi:predicted Zn-dependent protease